jgi:integrase
MASIEKTPAKTYKVRYRKPDGRHGAKTFKKRSDADKWLHTMEASKLKGEWIDPALGRTTIATWIDQWMATRRGLRPSSRQRDEGIVRNHILPRFATRRLHTITRADIEAWVTELHEGKGLAPSTVHRCTVIFAAALDAAVQHNMIARNVARGIEMPRRQRREMRYLDKDQIMALADVVPPRYRALILTAGFTGLRAGELAALRVDDLDLSDGTLRVIRSLSWLNGHPQEVEPKTKASRRTVTLPDFLVIELRRHLQTYGWPEGRVFTSTEGTPIRWNHWRERVWRPALRAAGLPSDVRIHDLRHSCASILILAGTDVKTVQARLGHANPSTTLDVYSHLFAGADEAAAKRLDALVSGPSVSDLRPI